MKTPTELCARCGNPVIPGSVFCSQCGSPVTPEESAATAATATFSPRTEAGQAEKGPSVTGEISWEFNASLLTNQFIMYDLLKVWGFSTLFLGLLMGGIATYDGKWRTLVAMAPVLGAVSAGFLVLLILVLLVFFGNRFPMGFNRLAVVLGALAGKPGVAGAGLLGMAQEAVEVVWDDVRRLNIHAPARVISLMDSWHVVMRLYCTPQNYEVVLNDVQKWAAGGLKKATQAPRPKGFTPIRRLWLKSLLAAAAAFLVTALPLPAPPLLIWSLFLVSLGAIWFLAFRRFFGIICLRLVGPSCSVLWRRAWNSGRPLRPKISANSPRVGGSKSIKSLIGFWENIAVLNICIPRIGCKPG
jgi:hypothetical protein